MNKKATDSTLGQFDPWRMHVEPGMTAVKFGYLHEVGVSLRLVRQRAGSLQEQLRPVGPAFPSAPAFLLVPGFEVPVALVFRLFDQVDGSQRGGVFVINHEIQPDLVRQAQLPPT
ncbi:hypothetical protein NKDENANG_00368 [Candidatus Entotheonellaceae bacterium PAL068K]